jgi:hypothetical protein
MVAGQGTAQSAVTGVSVSPAAFIADRADETFRLRSELLALYREAGLTAASQAI